LQDLVKVCFLKINHIVLSLRLLLLGLVKTLDLLLLVVVTETWDLVLL